MHRKTTRNQLEAVQKILNKNIEEIKSSIEESDTVAGDVQVQDKPLLKKKKKDHEVLTRQKI